MTKNGRRSVKRRSKLRALAAFNNRSRTKPAGTLRDGTNDAVDEQRVALEAVHDVHHVRLVHDLTIASEALVLEHDRQIVDAVGRGQATVAVGAVADDHHAGKSGIDLPGRVPVRVRMEPRRRRAAA